MLKYNSLAEIVTLKSSQEKKNSKILADVNEKKKILEIKCKNSR